MEDHFQHLGADLKSPEFWAGNLHPYAHVMVDVRPRYAQPQAQSRSIVDTFSTNNTMAIYEHSMAPP